MNEIDRVWEASDKFDSKVLQFVGFVIAGTFAGAGLVMKQLPLPYQPSPWVITLVTIGVGALVTFVWMAVLSAIGVLFAGPLDPRRLADAADYLDHDQEFERDMLPFIAQAFDTSLRSQERKARLFLRSFFALGIAFLCLFGGGSLYVLKPPQQGAIVTDKKPTSTPPATRPTASTSTSADSGKTKKPTLGPYIMRRSFGDSGAVKIKPTTQRDSTERDRG
jgi:hypothetical protein